MRFVAIGEAMLDVITGARSGHAPISVRPGGTAVNAALAAAAAGAEAAVVARVGNDAAGETIRAALRGAGVEDLLAVDPALPTGCFVRVAETTVADRGASAALAPADMVAAAGADAILVSGYTLDALVPALELGAAWTAVDIASPQDASRAAGARVVFASDTDLAPLAARFDVAVVKLGAEGAVAARGADVVRQPARPAATGIPVVGAGDALDAAMLVALAGGAELEEALRSGIEAAAAWIDQAGVVRMET